jgi:hypothetical protein
VSYREAGKAMTLVADAPKEARVETVSPRSEQTTVSVHSILHQACPTYCGQKLIPLTLKEAPRLTAALTF